MSIQERIRTLTEINKEIARLSKELSSLRKKAKEVNDGITQYILSKDQPGLKYDGKAFIVNKETKPVAKPKKSKEESYIQIIENYGIENPKDFLNELLKAGKEDKEVTKLKIQKIK
jgi:hypothetical protein